MIYVQHLLGVGHLQRALLLAEALTQRGFQVEIASGGMPQALALPAGVKLRQLSPVRSADGSFSRLLGEQDREIDDAWRERRQQQLLDLFYRSAPEVLITETFPFGRRMFGFELLPLLESARSSRTCRLVVASIRDILQPKRKPGRNQETCELIETFYDLVLVHGDERISRLEDSFALAARIGDKLSYTGYISRSAETTAEDRQNEVVVSAGGSDTGIEILKTAIAARPLSPAADSPWRILVSPSIGETEYLALQALATDGITVERNRNDFPQLLARARMSISQAGYNTITDLLACGTPAVVIPYAEADEVEQSLRAELLRRRGRVVMLAQAQLSALALAGAMAESARLESHFEVSLDGASRSAELIAARLLEQGGSRL